MNLTKGLTLCVCVADLGGSISLEPLEDVNEVISDAEEFEGAMPYTVVGTINFPIEEDKTPYLVIAKYPARNAVLYDTIIATNEEQAKSLFLGKKRNIGKNLEVSVVKNLSNLIKEYFS
jgi:hypothetical protein